MLKTFPWFSFFEKPSFQTTTLGICQRFYSVISLMIFFCKQKSTKWIEIVWSLMSNASLHCKAWWLWWFPSGAMETIAVWIEIPTMDDFTMVIKQRVNSWKPTYPTLGKGKSSSNVPLGGNALVQQWQSPSHDPPPFNCRTIRNPIATESRTVVWLIVSFPFLVEMKCLKIFRNS